MFLFWSGGEPRGWVKSRVERQPHPSSSRIPRIPDLGGYIEATNPTTLQTKQTVVDD